MQDALDTLLRDLDRKVTLPWLPQMALGRPVYDLLVSRLAAEVPSLTHHQTRNALHALIRLRGHGSDQEVFRLYVRYALHSEPRVRSEAVKLGVGLLRLHHWRGTGIELAQAADLDTLRAGLALGVEPSVVGLAQEFLGP